MRNALPIIMALVFFLLGIISVLSCMYIDLASWLWRKPPELIRSNARIWFTRMIIQGIVFAFAGTISLMTSQIFIRNFGFQIELIVIMLASQVLIIVIYGLIYIFTK